jgi:hypothetical protein
MRFHRSNSKLIPASRNTYMMVPFDMIRISGFNLDCDTNGQRGS